MNSKWNINELPSDPLLETRAVLKRLPRAHAALSELKGIAQTIPNPNILIHVLGLQEAKDSSAIENIITTHDELYKSNLQLSAVTSLEAKEVQNYVGAMKKGFARIQETALLTERIIKEVQQVLEGNTAGYRRVPGTSLKNEQTGEVIYLPPQDWQEIEQLMSALEIFINDNTVSDYDPIVKMAIIHFQFESIHPFYNGNGRTGRIINILYLITQGLLNSPILYLSSFIIRHKARYYQLLQHVRETNQWEDWILFIIQGVEETARHTIKQVLAIKGLMQEMKVQLRSHYKFYSQDLLNNLFKHPYTKIEFLEQDINVSRVTAANYLNTLAQDGLLKKEKLGTSNYYINSALFKLLTQ